MFSELNIQFKDSINHEEFFKEVPSNGKIDDVILMSKFSQTPEVKDDVIYHDKKTSSLILVFADRTHGIEVSMENLLDKESLVKLKIVTESFLIFIRKQAKIKNIKIEKINVGIHANDELIQTANPLGFWGYLGKNFYDNVISGALISILSSLVAYIKKPNDNTAYWVLISVLLALALKAIIEVSRFKGELVYADK